MSKRRPLLFLLEVLKANVNYNPLTGKFIWIKSRPKCRFPILIGQRADIVDSRGEYRTVCWKGIKYPAHRVAWLLMTETEVPDELDHEDTDGLNNAWENIREATSSNNNMNRKGYGKSGFKGVFKMGNKFHAAIQKDKIKYKLGYFDTAEEAYMAYCNASEELHGQYGRTNYKNK